MLKQRRKLGEAPKRRKNYQRETLDQDEFGGDIQDYQQYEVAHKQLSSNVGDEEVIDLQKQKQKNKVLADEVLKLASIQMHQKQTKSIPKQPKLFQNQPKVNNSQTIKTQEVLDAKILKQIQSKPISSNWTQFLKSQTKSPSKFNVAKKAAQKTFQSEYVALDCEFVECGSIEEVARISIIGENMTQLYQSYIKPKYKITDYRTHISGISYTHIKGAPSWEEQKPKVEKLLFKKIIVGHTIDKDLDVLGMTGWFGFKQVIDINKFSQFQQNGKLQGLRKLAFVFLQKHIQTGMHSSLQDAKITMELFKLKKEKIIQEVSREVKEKERMEKKRLKSQKQKKQ